MTVPNALSISLDSLKSFKVCNRSKNKIVVKLIFTAMEGMWYKNVYTEVVDSYRLAEVIEVEMICFVPIA